jgi:dTDP-4-dehydrorhamnose 3,5-epimerase
MAIQGVQVFKVPYLEDGRGNFQKIHFADAPSADWSKLEEVFFTRTHKGSIRGMHLQWGTCSASKIVKCLEGEVIDVLVDVRSDSLSYLEVFSKVLLGESQEAISIPKGVAHGYQVLSESAIMYYATDKSWCRKCDLTFNPVLESNKWPIEITNLSDKDQHAPKLEKFLETYALSGGFRH